MLAMPEINYIKHLRENEDLSISDIAKKLGINWRTAKKHADGEVPIPKIPGNKQGMMYTEKYGQIVDIWLEEGSLITTSNKSYSEWGDMLGSSVLATAILDRLLHHSSVFNIRGDSYRLKEKIRAGVVPTKDGSEDPQ